MYPTCGERLDCTTSNQVTITAYVGIKPLVLKYVCTSACALESTSVSLVSRNDIFRPCASAQKGAMSGGVELVGKRNRKLCVNGTSNEISPLEFTYMRRWSQVCQSNAINNTLFLVAGIRHIILCYILCIVKVVPIATSRYIQWVHRTG